MVAEKVVLMVWLKVGLMAVSWVHHSAATTADEKAEWKVSL